MQIILGGLFLFTPGFFLAAIGHSIPEPDIFYPLAMLAARFIAYGIALIYISHEPVPHKLWINIMVLIQAIDLSAGIFYTATGIVSLEISAFPMFNASWIIILILLWMPKQKTC
jgi:hypothetical protein